LYASHGCTNLANFLATSSMEGFLKPKLTSDVQRPDANGNFVKISIAGHRMSTDPTVIQTQIGDQPSQSSRLIFLSGYPSSSILYDLGLNYSIEPEFFRRHLSFLKSDRDGIQIDLHVLPSSRQTIFQTTIPSIGVHDNRKFHTWAK